LEVDDGVVGPDGIARTDPEIAPGPAREGDYGLVAYDVGQVRAMRGQIVAAVGVGLGATLFLGPVGGLLAGAAFATLQGVVMHFPFGVVPLKIRQIPPDDRPVKDTTTNLEVRPDGPGTFQTTIFSAFDVNGTDPVILSTRIDVSNDQGSGFKHQLVLTG